MYYLEEKCNTNKGCVILSLSNNMYQTSVNSFSHSDIDTFFPNVLKVPIGLINNKRYIESSETEEICFCREKTDEDCNNHFIHELTIFDTNTKQNYNFMKVDEFNAYYNSLLEYVKHTKKIRIIKSK